MSELINQLAIHQGTTPTLSLAEAVDRYARRGIQKMTVRRDKLKAYGLDKGRKLLHDAGIDVLGYSISAPMNALDRLGQDAQLEENKRVIEEAAAISAQYVIIITGGLFENSRDLALARAQASEALMKLKPFARIHDVRLAIEPVHPMLAADVSCVNSISQANDLCDYLGDGCGIVVDVYHVWWDPLLLKEMKRAGEANRLLAFHVSDWLVPTRRLKFDRGMIGDGVIDLRLIYNQLKNSGYSGPIEAEIFSQDNWWLKDPDDLLDTYIGRAQTCFF